MINLAQILTVDKSRLQRRLGILRADTVKRVNDAIQISLDLDQPTKVWQLGPHP